MHHDREAQARYQREYFAKRYNEDPEFKRKQLETSKRWSSRNPQRMSELQNDWNGRNSLKRTLYTIKSRAKKEGLPYDLTEEYMESIKTDTCPVLGCMLNYSNKANTKDPNKATIDRKIPELGYVQGNVAWLSFKANRMKSNASVQEMRALVNYLSRTNAAFL